MGPPTLCLLTEGALSQSLSPRRFYHGPIRLTRTVASRAPTWYAERVPGWCCPCLEQIVKSEHTVYDPSP